MFYKKLNCKGEISDHKVKQSEKHSVNFITYNSIPGGRLGLEPGGTPSWGSPCTAACSQSSTLVWALSYIACVAQSNISSHRGTWKLAPWHNGFLEPI